MIAVTVRAPFLITQAAASRLRDGGRVINISSVFAARPSPQALAYSMAKAAVNAMTQAAAAEFGERGGSPPAASAGISPAWPRWPTRRPARRNPLKPSQGAPKAAAVPRHHATT
jgi:3-oxoacyl-[acyl-carrier protein] reductase